MIWQDLVIAGANVLLAISIAEQVYYGFVEKKGYLLLRTSVPAAFALYVITAMFFSLTLYFSAALAGVNAVLWSALVWQRVRYGSA